MGSSEELLPPLICMEDYEHSWNRYLNVLYYFFCQDFVTSKPFFEGKRFALKRHPMIKNKEATFWHIISEGQVEDERLLDLRRCERICWPRPIIEAVTNGRIKVKWWKNKRGTEERILIALEDFSYLVVLADRGEYIMLWTAYCVKTGHYREKLRKEYEAYVSQKG
ncbi:MAG TPA: hypothetical protein VNG51_20575 [Ktedonobacteraceae bacterium]|nr:hypothetical protein [Ktedonobacteraceae bacterium]